MKTVCPPRNLSKRIVTSVTSLILVATATPLFAQTQSAFASGFNGPTKVDVTHPGGLLVSERGTGMNGATSSTAEPEVVASGLVGASGMTYSAPLRSMFIAESFAGRITRVRL